MLKGAQLEGSKIFSKEFLFENNIPTGETFFSSPNKAIDHLEKSNFPIVLKADGLAAGKGVLVASKLEEAKKWVKEVMEDSKFGVAGKNILIEECLFGTELSFMGILTLILSFHLKLVLITNHSLKVIKVQILEVWVVCLPLLYE